MELTSDTETTTTTFESHHLAITPGVVSRQSMTVRDDMRRLSQDRRSSYSQKCPPEPVTYTKYSCDIMPNADNVWPDSTEGFQNVEASYKGIPEDDSQFYFNIRGGMPSRRSFILRNHRVWPGKDYAANYKQNLSLCQCPPELVTCTDMESTSDAISSRETVCPDSAVGFENAKVLHAGGQSAFRITPGVGSRRSLTVRNDLVGPGKDRRTTSSQNARFCKYPQEPVINNDTQYSCDTMSLTETVWPDSERGYENAEASHVGIQGCKNQYALRIQKQDFNNVSQPANASNLRRRLSSMVDFSIHGMSSPDIVATTNPSRQMNNPSRTLMKQSKPMANDSRHVTKKKCLLEDDHRDLCHAIGEHSRNQSQQHEKVKRQAPWKRFFPERHLKHLQQGHLFPQTPSTTNLHTQQQQDPLSRVSLNCEQQQKQQLQNAV